MKTYLQIIISFFQELFQKERLKSIFHQIENYLKTHPRVFIAVISAAGLGIGLAYVYATSRPALAFSLVQAAAAPGQELDPDALNVVLASPRGNISLGDQKKEIVVMFDHPVVPLSRLEENAGDTKGVFRFEPKVEGRFRWYGSKICAFISASPWQPGKEYTVMVPRSAMALNKKKLKKDFSFSFKVKVPGLKVTSVYPSSGRIEYTQQFDVYFNFPVELGQVKKHLRISSGSKTYPFTMKHPPVSKDQGQTAYDSDSNSYYAIDKKYRNQKHVIVTNSAAFSKDTDIKISISKGLK